MTIPALPAEAVSRDSLIQRAVDWVFGYDFFLSYSHDDGDGYPRRLKERLNQAGFRVFLDQTDYVAGMHLVRETKRQVTKSRRVVVVGRLNALKSAWVKREVDVAIECKRTPVIIDINGAVAAAGKDAPVAALALKEQWLRLVENLPDSDGLPSDRAVSELVRGFHFTRQEMKRARVFATAAAVLALTTAIAFWQTYEARQSQRRAEAERDRAERNFSAAKQAADGLVFDIAQGLRNVEGLRTQSVKLILERAGKTFDELQTSVGSDPAIARSRTVMFNEFAKTYLRTGDIGAARRAGEQSLELAQMILDGPSGHTAQASGDVGAGRITLGDVARQSQDLQAARSQYDEALSAYQTAAQREPSDTQWQRNIGAAWNRLAQVSYWLGDLRRSRQEFENSLAIDRRLLAVNPSSARDQRGLAAALNNVGNVAQALGDYRAAIGHFEESVAIVRSALAADDTNTLLREYLTTTLANLGDAHKSLGQRREAAAAYEEGLATARALAKTDPTNIDWQFEVTKALNKVGDLAKEDAAFDAALSAYAESLALRRKIAAIESASNRRQRDLAVSVSKVGEIEMATGRLDKAQAHYLESLAIRKKLVDIDRANTEWQTDLAMQYIRLGDLDKLKRNFTVARDAFAESLAIFRKLEEAAPANEENRRLVGVALNRIGEAHLGARDLAQALQSFEEVLDLRKRLLAARPDVGEWQRDLSVSLLNLGETLVALGRKGEAVRVYEESLTIRQALAAQGGDSALQRADLAEAQWRLGSLKSGPERRALLGEAQAIVLELEKAGRLTTEQEAWPAEITALVHE
jgi:tetratricopeptide (TPR) repeat protein